MHAVHLAGMDLNLLVALDALLVERSVTLAARRVGLTQPAMSHALSRLRELLGDPLFVRTRTEMMPTARALLIAPVLARALGDIRDAIAEPPEFDPATATRTFRIAMSDYMEFVLLPALVQRLSESAPNLNLEVRVMPMELDGLASGALDLAIRPTLRDLPTGFRAQTIFASRFVCLMRKGHPLTRRKLTLDRYCAANHALISPGGMRGGLVDDQLARLGRSRRVALVLQHFLVAPHVVAGSDLVVTLGERVARAFQTMLPLAVRELPFTLDGFGISQIWHDRQAHDTALTWLRAEIGATARALQNSHRTA